MEGKFSDNFKRKFLITFTKELIKHSGKMDIIKLENIINLKEKIEMINSSQNQFQGVSQNRPLIKEIEEKSFEMPLQRIPLHLEYLKPKNAIINDIDLYKITSLVQNPEVKMIIANPDEKVSIIEATGTRITDITLSKEDIDRIINSFSEKSKVPIEEGIYKINFGNLTLSAVISQIIGSRFVIKKNSLPYPTIAKN